MFTWIAGNIATLLICLVLFGIVTAIVINMIRNRRKGKSACGCGCQGCPMSDSCHKQ